AVPDDRTPGGKVSFRGGRHSVGPGHPVDPPRPLPVAEHLSRPAATADRPLAVTSFGAERLHRPRRRRGVLKSARRGAPIAACSSRYFTSIAAANVTGGTDERREVEGIRGGFRST